MLGAVRDQLDDEVESLRRGCLFKEERVIDSPQGVRLALADGRRLLNFCANDYLGIANYPALVDAAKQALDRWGYGMASVRFICGTQSVHKVLEDRLSDLLRTEETILFSSCFDANGAVFETLLDEEDVVISDELNHASIIDGIRLSKARRSRYANCDLGDLEEQLVRARRGGARRMLIVTDGVFSMDGAIAPLQGIVELADEYEALVMVDDSHATGFIGATGAGTHEQFGVLDRIDILTGTLGKALGGASGGYVSGRAEVVAVLRQRARPYLFSNSLAPCIAAATLTALDLVRAGDGRRAQLRRNTERFRNAMQAASFQIGGLEHPIAPVMFGSAACARQVAERLADEGIYAIAFARVCPMKCVWSW